MKVELLSRTGCHLCTNAHGILERVRADIPFELIKIDVDGAAAPAPQYRMLYGSLIPVVLVAGEVVASIRVEETALREALIRAQGMS